MTSGAIPAAAAGTWTLGDLTVNRIGFGAMRLTENADGTPSDRDRAIAVLRRALELGVNHIDTAAFYFSPLRSANELINRALAPYPDDLVIATKVWPGRDPSGRWWWAAPAQLRGQVEENLRQLGRDYLDVVNLRLPRRMATGSIAEHSRDRRSGPPGRQRRRGRAAAFGGGNGPPGFDPACPGVMPGHDPEPRREVGTAAAAAGSPVVRDHGSIGWAASG